MGNHYLKLGLRGQQSKSYSDALKNYDLAIAQGDPQVSVTASVGAAFTVNAMDKPDYAKMKHTRTRL